MTQAVAQQTVVAASLIWDAAKKQRLKQKVVIVLAIGPVIDFCCSLNLFL
jgi:hypothetical protein